MSTDLQAHAKLGPAMRIGRFPGGRRVCTYTFVEHMSCIMTEHPSESLRHQQIGALTGRTYSETLDLDRWLDRLAARLRQPFSTGAARPRVPERPARPAAGRRRR